MTGGLPLLLPTAANACNMPSLAPTKMVSLSFTYTGEELTISPRRVSRLRNWPLFLISSEPSPFR